LVEKLVEKGFDTTIIDSKIYGNFLRKDLQKEVKIIYEDIRSLKKGIEIIKNSDVIIHLAGIVGDQACDLIKEKSVDINLNGSKNIIRLVEKFNKKIIYASTCSVYGANNSLINENSKVLPLSIYALTKYAVENFLRESDTKYTIFRMGTLFGFSPRMRIDLVVNTFIINALTNKPIIVFGGKQWRPFLHLEDACEFYIKTLDLDFFENQLLNLGGRNFKIMQVAKEIKKHINCEVKVTREIKDPRNYKVDSSLAKKIFKINFKRKIHDGVKDIKEAYEDGLIDISSPTLNNYEYLRLKKDEI